jgi:hypothetical protein
MVKLPDGLQFIVFLPVCSASAPVTAAPRAANYTSIDVLIRLHGLDRLGNTAQRQVEIWESKISPIAKCFAELDKAGPTEPDGRPSSLTRLVLDVEVGGIFYATVGNHGCVFAATLDQQPLNSGLAEKYLITAVNRLDSLISGLSGPVCQK